MPVHSYARYLAPLALVAFTLALITVVTSSGSDPSPSASEESTEAQPAAQEGGGEGDEDSSEPRGPRRYRVQPGDTPSTIAEETGVPLERLEELNPDLDPQQLTPGQRIRLR